MNIVENIPKKEISRWEYVSSIEESSSVSDITGVYMEGEKKGLEEAEGNLVRTLSDHINKTGELATELLPLFKKMGISIHATYLKINSLNEFKILLTVPEKMFLSDSILSAYDAISDLEREQNKDSYYLDISITSDNEYLSEERLKFDGFDFKLKMP